MPSSYSWLLVIPTVVTTGSAPSPGPAVPGIPLYQSPKRRQFERGIKFGNVPGGDPGNLAHGGSGTRIFHVNTTQNVLQTPSDKFDFSGVIRFRDRKRSSYKVPPKISLREFRESDRFGNEVYPWSGRYPDGYIFFAVDPGVWDANATAFRLSGSAQSRYAGALLTSGSASGSVIIAGGLTGSSLSSYTSFAQVWSSGSGFIPTAAMPTAKAMAAGTGLSNGDFLIVGGFGADNNEPLRCYRWIAASGTWFTPSSSPIVPRSDAEVIQMNDGRVFAPGGAGLSGSLSTTTYTGSLGHQITGSGFPESHLPNKTRYIWKCDQEGGPTFVADSLGVRHIDTLVLPAQPTTGIFSTAWQFSGSGRAQHADSTFYSTFPAPSTSDEGQVKTNGGWSVGMWIKFNNIAERAEQCFISLGSGSGGNSISDTFFLKLRSSTNQINVGSTDQGNTTFNSGFTFTQGTWYNIIVTREVGQFRMFVNGVDKGTAATTLSTLTGANRWVIGSGTQGACSCTMDDIWFENSTWTQSMAATEFNRAVPATVYSPFTGSEIFNPATNVWTGSAGIPLSPINREGYSLTKLFDGSILMVGGRNPSDLEPTKHVMRYYPSSGTFGTWTVEASMSFPRYGHRAELTSDGKVLIAGGTTDYTTEVLPDDFPMSPGAGFGSTDTWNNTEIYDPSNGTVSPGLPFIESRSHFCMISYSNRDRIVMTAGQNTGSNVTSTLMYDVAENIWTEYTDPPRGPAFAKIFKLTSTAPFIFMIPGGELSGSGALSSSLVFTTTG